MSELTLEEVEALLASTETKTFPRPIQNGPLRYYEATLICTSRRCSSPTYLKVQGMPLCVAHALQELNQICISKGINV